MLNEIRKQLSSSMLSILVFLPILLIAYEKGGTIQFDAVAPAASPAASPAPSAAPGGTTETPVAVPSPAAAPAGERPAGSGSSEPMATPPGETLPGGAPLVPSPAPVAVEPSPSAAPAGSMVEVSGKVYDVDSKTAVGQTEIVVPELEIETFTNHKGEYHLKPLPARAKPYELMIQRPGYTNSYESLDASKPGKVTKDINIRRKGFED